MTLPDDLGTFASIPLELEGRLDRRAITMRELLALTPGSIVRLERPAGENIDVVAGGALLGYGEVVIVDEVVAIRVTDFREER